MCLESGMHTVGFIHSKGGVGKTTLAIMIALSLEHAGFQVELLDSDPQGSATRWSERAEDVGTPLPFDVRSAPSARSLRAAVSSASADIAVIDTPPGTPEVLDAAVDLVDLALIPSGASPMDIDRVWPTMQLLAHRPTAVVLNAIDARESVSSVAREVLESEGIPVAEATIPMRASARRAFGTIPDVAEHYRALAKEVLEALH